VTPLLHAIHYQPWLITPEAHAAMCRAAGNLGLFTDPPQPTSPPALLTVERGVGIVTIHGALMKRPDFFSRLLLGATDMEDVGAALVAARDRQDVQAVFLDVDSPGGTVNGTPELAALVADVSKAKYTYAFTDGQMCSAAYWIASQSDAVFATPSARVGSIGVLLPMLDESKAFEQAGVKVELFAAGKYKSVGVPGVSLTDEQRAWLQADIDEIYADFKAAVLARGRRITPDVMEGQCFSGRKASYNSLTSGVVQDRATALMKLRERHVQSPAS
jgi:signal peptide peptidase SppA